MAFRCGFGPVGIRKDHGICVVRENKYDGDDDNDNGIEYFVFSIEVPLIHVTNCSLYELRDRLR